MLALGQAGPMGRAPIQFALFYVLGFVGMALMIHFAPPGVVLS